MPNEKKIDNIRVSKKPFRVLDIFVFAAVILVSVLILVISFSQPATYVEIFYNGATQRHKLDVDKEITVKEGYVVVIKDGACYVEETDCKTKKCKHSGTIKYANRMIICADFGIIIKVLGDSGNRL